MLLGYILYINQIISDRFFVIWLNGRSSAWISPGYTQHMQVSEKGKLRLFWICGILRVFDGFLRFFAGFLRVNLDVFFWSQMVSGYAVVIFKAILGDTMQKLRFTAVSSQGFHRKWVWVAHLRSSWSRSNHPYGVQVKQVPSVHPGCWLKSCSEIPHSAFPGRWHTKVFVVPQVKSYFCLKVGCGFLYVLFFFISPTKHRPRPLGYSLSTEELTIF